MKPPVRLLLLALAAALLALGLTRWLAPTPAPADPLAWLRDEFHLTPAQTSAIGQLQTAYEPVCDAHCRLIRDNHRLLAALAAAVPRDPAALASALAESTRLQALCNDSTRRHLEAVAALMPPSQGARFLALTLPKIALQSHAAPLDLR